MHAHAIEETPQLKDSAHWPFRPILHLMRCHRNPWGEKERWGRKDALGWEAGDLIALPGSAKRLLVWPGAIVSSVPWFGSPSVDVEYFPALL